jgi:hypothetical protein
MLVILIFNYLTRISYESHSLLEKININYIVTSKFRIMSGLVYFCIYVPIPFDICKLHKFNLTLMHSINSSQFQLMVHVQMRIACLLIKRGREKGEQWYKGNVREEGKIMFDVYVISTFSWNTSVTKIKEYLHILFLRILYFSILLH